MPSAAWREWQRLPVGFIETILEMRAYWHAKARYDAKGQRTDDSPMTQLVIEHDFALVQERRK